MVVLPIVQAWPFPYLMFASADDSQSIRVQNDRFSLGWAFTDERVGYPGYDQLSEVLAQRFEELSRHLYAETSQALTLTGAECSYTNNLEGYSAAELFVGIATRWEETLQSSADIPANYAGLRLHTCTDADMQGCTVNLSLDVDQDGTFLILESERDLTADDDGLRLAGLDVAHEQLIKMFVQYTSPEMHKKWGRQV